MPGYVAHLKALRDAGIEGVKAAAGVAKVPQVFIDGTLVGGADQLEKFLSAG